MTALVLALAWLAAVPLALALRRGRRRRLAALLPAVLGPISLVVAAARWPGALAGGGTDLALGRPGAGLLALAGPATAVAVLLAPGAGGTEVAIACAVAAAAVLLLSATAPLVWATAAAAAMAIVAVRWITRAPGRPTLAAGRIAGLGAAALLVSASLLPPALVEGDARSRVAGLLLAAGLAACLAVLPLGGWAAGAVSTIRGIDVGLWSLLAAPALLVSAGRVVPELVTATRDTATTALLVAALAGSLWAGLQAFRADAATRYARLWLADLALAVAGLASLHDAGRLGGWLLVVSHVVVGPLLLQRPRPGTQRPHRVAWLALTGVPPAPAAWGRLLVLEGLAATGRLPLVLGVIAAAITTGVAVRSLVANADEPAGAPAARPVRVLAWTTVVAALAVGLAPDALAGRLLGVSLG